MTWQEVYSIYMKTVEFHLFIEIFHPITLIITHYGEIADWNGTSAQDTRMNMSSFN